MTITTNRLLLLLVGSLSATKKEGEKEEEAKRRTSNLKIFNSIFDSVLRKIYVFRAAGDVLVLLRVVLFIEPANFVDVCRYQLRICKHGGLQSSLNLNLRNCRQEINTMEH
jgi:hypothetical protein